MTAAGTKILRSTAITLSVFVVLLFATHAQQGFFLPTKLFIEVQSRQADTYQVFYDSGHGYNETESVRSFLKGSGPFEILSFRLPGMKINKIRIDPGTKPGNVLIRKICSKSLLKQRCWTGQELSNEYTPLHDISGFETRDGLLSITSTGEDPYFELKGDFPREQSIISPLSLYPVAFLLSLALFFLLYWDHST